MSLLVAALLSCGLQDPEVTVLRGGRIVTVAGRDVENGTLVLERGKIRKVGGPDLPTPPGATVIEVPAGAQILPGFVDLHSHLGSAFEVEEPAESVTPEMKAVEAFTSAHPDVREALGSGVTTVALAPGNGNLVGGRVGAIKLNGGRYDRALFRDSVALKASLTDDALRRDREPTSRTGATRLLRQFLAGGRPSLPLLVYASTTAEIQAAIDASGGVSMILVGARDSGRMAEALRGAVAGVAFGPLTVNDRKEALEAPGRLARAGIPLAFVSDAPATAEMHLRVTAAFAVKHGLDRGVALRALTAAPAEFLGLGKEIGTIEEGRDADLVVWTGDPLNLSSGVETVLVNGKVTWRRSKP